MKTKLLYLLLLVFSISYTQIPTANLVGHYDFSQGALTDNISNVSFTKTGTASTIITDRFGNANEAISLNGDDLTRPDIEFDVTNTNPFLPRTVSFWLKTSAIDGNVRIIYNDNDQTSMSDTNFIGLTVYLQNGKVNASNRVGTNGNLFTHPTIITDNLWHHVVVQAHSNQLTGNTKSFSTFIHVDGIKIGGSGYNGTASNLNVRANKHIGNVSFSRLKTTSLTANNKYQDGIDEVLFYTRILSDSEINIMASDTGNVTNPTINFVNQNATGNNDGTSWADAYNNIQDALTNVGIGEHIWVASGTYKPSVSDRNTSFLVNRSLYGGFAGTEINLSDRDMSLIHTTNATILSGDLLGDDDATVDFNDATRDDNSKHVVEVSINNIEINGVIIQDGYADDTTGDDRFGGGVFKETSVSTLTVKNCVIKNNIAFTGAGLALTTTGTSNIIVDACIFEENLANGAAGLDVHLSGTNGTINFTLTNSLFKNNITEDDASKNRTGFGGAAARIRAAFSGVGLNTDVINNTFVNNISSGTTSGTSTDYPVIEISKSSGFFNTIYVVNNIFWGNVKSGGATTVAIGRAANYTRLEVGTNVLIENNIDEDSFSLISSTTQTSTSDPLFTNAVSDFTLQINSPAIDSGNNNFVSSLEDILGHERIFNTTVDMGAYEFGSSLGIDDFDLVNEEIILYPNPTTSILNIKMDVPLKRMTIFNMHGQKVIENILKQVDVSTLSKGMYVIKVEDDNGYIATKQFVKQ